MNKRRYLSGLRFLMFMKVSIMTFSSTSERIIPLNECALVINFHIQFYELYYGHQWPNITLISGSCCCLHCGLLRGSETVGDSTRRPLQGVQRTWREGQEFPDMWPHSLHVQVLPHLVPAITNWRTMQMLPIWTQLLKKYSAHWSLWNNTSHLLDLVLMYQLWVSLTCTILIGPHIW